MSNGSPDEEKKKKFIFDSMSKRNRKKILDKGYDNWNPFEKPKDPIDLREADKRETATTLTKKFLQTVGQSEYSREYGKGVFEICMGIIGDEDRYRAMYEFSCWYKEFKEKRES